jgi:hypothetical protein
VTNRRKALGAIGAILAVLTPATALAAAAPPTKADVGALVAAESKVVALLHAYQPTAAWKANYRAAAAAQARDLAKLNADLAGPPAKTAPGPATGTFADAGGATYSVTPIGIVHPAQPTDEFNQPTPGDFLLAVEFKVKDTSARYEVSDDADLDMTIVASNDQTYTASFNTVTECTNFNHGDFQLEPGASVVGCVVFELPSNLRATDVKWTDASGLFNDWRVAP